MELNRGIAEDRECFCAAQATDLLCRCDDIFGIVLVARCLFHLLCGLLPDRHLVNRHGSVSGTQGVHLDVVRGKHGIERFVRQEMAAANQYQEFTRVLVAVLRDVEDFEVV